MMQLKTDSLAALLWMCVDTSRVQHSSENLSKITEVENRDHYKELEEEDTTLAKLLRFVDLTANSRMLFFCMCVKIEENSSTSSFVIGRNPEQEGDLYINLLWFLEAYSI